MKTRNFLLPILALLASLGAALWAAPEASAQGTARAYLEGRHHEVNRILQAPATNEAARTRRSERLSQLLNDLLDYEALSQAALGDHWAERSEEERAHFVSLLRQLVQRNYETNLERIVDFEVSYDSERRRGEDTIVTTSARSRAQRRQPPVEIEYTMRAAGSRWRVVDVTTDGVSMVQNYRNQFTRIISREGWGELIARMEHRLESGQDT
jgi:phospholipid transport system substrate-binding protein